MNSFFGYQLLWNKVDSQGNSIDAGVIPPAALLVGAAVMLALLLRR